MIETADLVAQRYGVSREAQDLFALESQRRTAAAQAAGLFDDEIAPMTVMKNIFDPSGATIGQEQVTLAADEGNRPSTTLEGLAKLKPVREGQFVTAGNASQFSDGAALCVLMSAPKRKDAIWRRSGIFRGFAARAATGGNGHWPGVRRAAPAGAFWADVADIDLWELNEAFASQAIYCRDRLGLTAESSTSTAAPFRSAIPSA